MVERVVHVVANLFAPLGQRMNSLLREDLLPQQFQSKLNLAGRIGLRRDLPEVL